MNDVAVEIAQQKRSNIINDILQFLDIYIYIYILKVWWNGTLRRWGECKMGVDTLSLILDILKIKGEERGVNVPTLVCR